jgi:GntR family transcriptional regulator
MTLFSVHLRPGQSIFDQVVSAAQRSILGGEFAKGQAFPSVRTIAAELRIHPNTAHKVVQYLIQERWLEMMPGIGTVVAGPPRRLADTKRELLTHEIARLVAEAKRVGLDLEEVLQAIRQSWTATVNPSEVSAK